MFLIVSESLGRQSVVLMTCHCVSRYRACEITLHGC